MKLSLIATAVLFAASAPAFAGDAAKGEKEFKKCKACHMIVADDGPNLYGVVGRAAGSTDFKNGESLAAAGAAGLIWDEASIAAYVADPKAFLVEHTGDAAAKTKMSFKLAKGGDDVAAYLASVGPAAN
jgi:cytochrome c